MSEKSYLEKLKDPRWQKKRLEILNRDDWECQLCKDKLSQLVVHHIFYLGYIDPWEYDDVLLATLCEKCHSDEHSTYQFEDRKFNNRRQGLMNIEFNNMIFEFLSRVCDNPYGASKNIHAIKLPKRISILRESKQKEFEKTFHKGRKEYIKNLSESERQKAYNLSKQSIGEHYLTNSEYEEKIKKLAKDLGI